MPKICITGALGLVGSSTSRYFKQHGWEVIGVDTNMREQFFGTPHKNGDVLSIDIRDQIAINDLFEANKFDAVIHAAAQPSHDYSTDHVLEDFDINARGTVILLEAARLYCPQATFVHISTDKVYGENMQHTTLSSANTRLTHSVPFDEELGLDFAGHRSFFGCSKAAADMYVQEYNNEFGLVTGIFRPGCITGAAHEGAEQHGFLAYLAKCIRDGTPYKIFGFEGMQVRDQIHAWDLASAINEFVKKPNSGAVYNIGGGPERSVSVLEAIDLIEKDTGKVADYQFYPARKGDRPWDVHDVSKFRGDYPEWDYTYSLNDIIKDVCSKV